MITREKCQTIRREMESALARIASEHGLAVTIGNCRFTPDTMKFTQVTFVGPSVEGGELDTLEARTFKRNAHVYGLSSDDLGRRFVFGGERYTLVGCKPRAHTYPLLCRRDDGRLLKMTMHTVKYALEKESLKATAKQLGLPE